MCRISYCHSATSDADCWMIRTLFIAMPTSGFINSAPTEKFLVFQFLWISSNSCPLNFLLVLSHQAEITIVKRLIQGRNNVTRVRVESRSCDQGRRKKMTSLQSRPRCLLAVHLPYLSGCSLAAL